MLRLTKYLSRELAESVSTQTLLHLEDILQTREEPLVDVGHLPDLVNRVTLVEGRPESEDTLVSRVDKFFINVLNNVVLARIGISEGP